ncbi:hypothetical protein DsansV1_C08g0083881 [Dioscorea sansibarensis]
MSSGRRSAHGMPPIARRQHDEDLALFKEMIKREKEPAVSLLQPISVEFESGEGNYPLYKIPSWKKEADFLAAADGKNDYDWLKTPPGTPLFPSLDLEAEDPLLNMAVHKELPILQLIKPSRVSFIVIIIIIIIIVVVVVVIIIIIQLHFHLSKFTKVVNLNF